MPVNTYYSSPLAFSTSSKKRDPIDITAMQALFRPNASLAMAYKK